VFTLNPFWLEQVQTVSTYTPNLDLGGDFCI